MNNFFLLLIRKLDPIERNFRGPFVKELLKDSGGPSLHPLQWGESEDLKNPGCLIFTRRNRFVKGFRSDWPFTIYLKKAQFDERD